MAAAKALFFTTTASGCRHAIRWLHDHGVPGERLAALFETSPQNIRVLCHRAGRFPQESSRLMRSALREPLDPAIVASATLAASVGIRREIDLSIVTRRTKSKIEELTQQIESTSGRFAADYRFLDGARALTAIGPHIGFPSSLQLKRLRSKLYHYRAWFYVHSGLCVSALHEARQSMKLSTLAFRDSNDAIDLKQIADSGLIASNACLLRNDPHAAYRFLKIVKQAFDSASIAPGSEYYQQSGTVYLQDTHSDDLTVKSMRKAAEIMDRLGEAKYPEQILMVGMRREIVLTPDWDNAQELLARTSRAFSKGTLEHAMNIHWAAASGLLVDDSDIQQEAVQLIENNRSMAARFGHQATIAKLLSLTPHLNLPPRTRTIWIRRCLYENVFRND